MRVKRRTMISLISRGIETSRTGFQRRQTETSRQVMAEESGVGRAEFYKAAAVGMDPSVTFIVSEADYERERLLMHEGKMYRVIRTYPTSMRRVELICQGVEPNDD